MLRKTNTSPLGLVFVFGVAHGRTEEPLAKGRTALLCGFFDKELWPDMNRYSLRSVLHGATIYAAGDTIASILLGEFSLTRMLGIMGVGATFYAFEIPRYFSWIDRTVKTAIPWLRACQRISLALAYFNPLWIARHLAFIQLFSGRFHEIGFQTLKLGAMSWAANIPILILGNYIIQMVLPLRWRFFGSAVFSACLAVYYAFSEVLFG